MSKISKIAKAVFMSFAMLLFLHTPVLADDNKEYPGAMCQPDQVSGSGNGGIEARIAYSGLTGGVVNLDRAVQTVVCPIVRDVGSTLGTTVAVRNDNGAAVTVSCEIRAYRAGGIVDRSLQEFVVGPGETRYTTTALSTKIAGEPGGAGGTYALVCQLPSQVHLLAYFVREQT